MSRVLVVEDSPTQAAHIGLVLEEAGYEVTAAADGAHALRSLSEKSFDLLLSDVNMPGISGYELCSRVRATPSLAHLPIILLTSRSDPMAIVRGLECGADNFITKPYEPTYLVERVRTILDAKQRRQGKLRVGVDISFLGRKFVITSEKEQILDLLLSTFEEVVRTNAELEARTEELDSVLESIGDGVAVTDTEGKLILSNQAASALLGAPPAQGTMEDWLNGAGLFCMDRVTPFPSPQYPLVQALTGITPGEIELFVRNPCVPNGATLCMNARPMLNRAGLIRGAVLVIRDVSQRKAAEVLLNEQARELSLAKEQAERESRYKSRFLANMSHELRTPLNAILGFTELLAEELIGPLNARQKQYVGYVAQSGDHLLALVNDVLDISKIEANKLDLVREWIEPLSVIQAAAGVVRPLADKKNVALVLEAEDGLPPLFVDPVRMKQILYNLLSNGVKFTPGGGTVTLEAYAEAQVFTLTVRDTGAGIAPENIQRLFREFEQIEQASGRKSEGAGLGLALTKRLVELHGGSISVESALQRGSAFTIALPLSPPEDRK